MLAGQWSTIERNAPKFLSENHESIFSHRGVPNIREYLSDVLDPSYKPKIQKLKLKTKPHIVGPNAELATF